MEVCRTKGITLRRILNKVTGILRCDSTFVNLMKTVMNFAVTFEKCYGEKFVATSTLDTVKDMIGSHFLKIMRSLSYYRYDRVAKKILKHESILALVESQHDDTAVSKRLGIIQWDDKWL